MAEQLAFLGFKAGDVVLVEPSQGDPACGNKQDWWMGQIIWVEGGARDPSAPSLFQAADVDTGQVRWINADEATRLVIQNDQPDQNEVYDRALST